MIGFQTLLLKEILRFWKVGFQTVAAPVLTALLYLFIFSHVMSASNAAFAGVSYDQFLIPGLAMMSMLQNAFANTSSSLIQSKITGNILFILLPPLSHWNFYFAYLIAAVIRALAVGLGVFLVGIFVAHVPVHNIVWIVAFALLGSGLLAAMGILAGLWADNSISSPPSRISSSCRPRFCPACFIRFVHCPTFGAACRISIRFFT